MSDFDNARKVYESIEIPTQLGEMVASVVEGQERKGKVVGMRKKGKVWKGAACLMGLVVVAGTISLNTSEAFASALSGIPVIGRLVDVLVVRDYSYQDEDKEISAQVPAIVEKDLSSQAGEQTEGEVSGVKTDYVEQINASIENAVKDYVEQAEQNIAEYKKAFLETGGTEEQFKEKDIKVDVNHEVKHEGDSMISIVLTANENWSNAYGVQYFYNLNLEDGREITLKELLGDDYINTANEQILAQMKERVANDSSASYFGEDMGGFTTIDDTTNFYINKAGNPVIVFEKYAVAPGSMGIQEFEISK